MDTEGLEFTQIYAIYQPKIHSYLIHMVGEYEAEDLTQEVFVRVSQALGTFRGEAVISTWIYRIASNLAVDRMRSSAFTKSGHCGNSERLSEYRKNQVTSGHRKAEEPTFVALRFRMDRRK